MLRGRVHAAVTEGPTGRFPSLPPAANLEESRNLLLIEAPFRKGEQISPGRFARHCGYTHSKTNCSSLTVHVRQEDTQGKAEEGGQRIYQPPLPPAFLKFLKWPQADVRPVPTRGQFSGQLIDTYLQIPKGRWEVINSINTLRNGPNLLLLVN